MPGNEPPDPLLTFILDLLRLTRAALDTRGGSAEPAVAEASRAACRCVDGAIAALSGEKADA